MFWENDVESDTMSDLLYGTPAELAVKVLRVLLPNRARQVARMMAEMVKSLPEATADPSPAEAKEPAEPKPAGPRAFARLLQELRGKKSRRRKHKTKGRRADGKRCKRRFSTVDSPNSPVAHNGSAKT